MSHIVLATVTLAIQVPSTLDAEYVDGYVSDAVNEILRGQQQPYNSDSCLVDYTQGEQSPCNADPENYSEGDAFKTLT